MTRNERFRLTTATSGVRVKDGKPSGGTVLIPSDSVIEIVSGVETLRKLIEVDWEGVRVMLFVEDVQQRGELVDGSSAEASHV